MVAETELRIRVNADTASIGGIKAVERAIQNVKEENEQANRLAGLLAQEYRLSQREASQVAAQLKRVQSETAKAAREGQGLQAIFEGIAQGIGQQITQAGLSALRDGLAAISGVTQRAISEFESFEAALTEFDAKSDASAEQIERIGEQARELATVTSQTPAGVAALSTALLTLGATADEVEENLESITKLADVLGEDPVLTGQVVQTGVNIFGEFGETADTLSDKLNFLINNSAAGAQGGLNEFFQLFADVGGIVSATGAEFDDLASAFAILRNGGASASVAATGLKTALLALSAPTSSANAELQRLGVSAFDNAGEFRGLGVTLEDFSQSLASLSEQEQIRVAEAVFGREGAPAFLQAVKEANGDLGELRRNLEAEAGGSLQESLEVINQSLARQAELLQGNISSALTDFGQALAPVRLAAVEFANDVLSAAVDSSEGFGQLTAAGERLNAVLEENPEIAQQLAESLASIADSLTEVLASGLDIFANFLEESPERIEAFFEPIENGFRVLEGFANLLQAASESGAEFGLEFVSAIDLLSTQFGPLPVQIQTVNDGLEILVGLFERLGLIAPDSVQALSQGLSDLASEVNEGLASAQRALDSQELNASVDITIEEASEPEGPSIESIESRFDELETLRQIDLANQRAALVEGGATQEAIVDLEQRFLDQRIQQARARLAELRAINTEGLDAEDTEQVQREILAAEQAVAEIRLQIAEDSAEQRERIAQAATQAELEALNETLAREQEVASIRRGLIEQQANQLSNEQSLLSQQQGLATAQLELEREKLETRLAAAEAAEDEVEADRLREQINQVNRAAIQQEFEFKRQSLELTRQQAILDAERQSITAQIALTEAEIAIQKAEAEGASQAEVNNLRQIADLRQQAVAAADAEIATVTEINELKARELDIREEIARQEQQQAELSQVDDANRVVEALEKQLDVRRSLSSVLDGNARLQAEALSRQNTLLAEQQNLANAERNLERERLETRLAQAEATGRETQAERLRQQIAELNQEAAEAELEFKRRQLELANQQVEIELRRQEIAAQIALTEARINLEKARAEGASNEELAGLAQIVGLRQDELSAIDDTRRANEELAKLREEQLDIEEQITQENERQSRIRGRTASPTSLRKGGPVEAGGLYQVHKDEFFVPAQNGSILNQRDSRAAVQAVLSANKAASLTTAQPVLSARATAALMGASNIASKISASQSDTTSLRNVERQLSTLIDLVQEGRRLQVGGDTYNLINEADPYRAVSDLQMARLRSLVRTRGL